MFKSKIFKYKLKKYAKERLCHCQSQELPLVVFPQQLNNPFKRAEPQWKTITPSPAKHMTQQTLCSLIVAPYCS